MNQKIIKEKISSVKLPVQVTIIGALLSLLFFWMLIDSFKTYQATVTVLVNAKSQMAANQHEQIMASLQEIPSTLGFYDRLLNSNKDVRDIAQGKSPLERKKAWNQLIHVEREDDSSLLEISIRAKQQFDAEQLTVKAARNLLDTASMYYNVKDDLDLRIIDGPLTKVSYDYWFAILVFSLLLGFTLAAALNLLFATSKDSLAEKTTMFKKFSWPTSKKKSLSPELEPDADLQAQLKDEPQEGADLFEVEDTDSTYFAPEKAEFFEKKTTESEQTSEEEMQALNKIIEHDIYPNFPEMPTRAKSTGSAPSNLPVADEDFKQTGKESAQEKAQQEPLTKAEPTPEELKKRLNQLLRGEL